jgi:hypothetical protein
LVYFLADDPGWIDSRATADDRRSGMQDQLLAIERRLWTNDAAFYEAHLTDDALLIYLGKPALSRGMSQSRQSERRTPKAGNGNRLSSLILGA